MRWCTMVMAAATGCVGPGLLTDGTSVSLGTHSRGILRGAAPLPFRGEGYLMPPKWRIRKRNYGTDELTGLIKRSAKAVHRQYQGSILGVADLSQRGGGATAEHKSHHSGRDVDLIFYYTDRRGRPIVPTAMLRVGASNGYRFDAPRNWALIKHLLHDTETKVQWIFIGRQIITRLLQHARSIGEPEWIITHAAQVMLQPSDAQDHMDHLHLRVFCASSDQHQGCVNRGPTRWLKKTLKYALPGRMTPAQLLTMTPNRPQPFEL